MDNFPCHSEGQPVAMTTMRSGFCLPFWGSRWLLVFRQMCVAIVWPGDYNGCEK